MRPTNIFQHGIDLASSQELIAHGKTREEIARHIKADDVIFQDLNAMMAACTEASPHGQIKDFEVGVFCGKYITPVPEGYFEHLNEVRGTKRKHATHAQISSSGPTIVTGGGQTGTNGFTQHATAAEGDKESVEKLRNGAISPLIREDISLHNVATEPERR